MTRPYRGRFAPSPTGPLHAGSLVAAIASFLDARAHGGQWYLRIDDADRPRSVPGVSERIIAELQRLGLLFDGDVRFQAA
ncbi:MAG: tRNA glutamyl-Q(34) synthetase GluQRS, partial [Chromatiales bacterium]|nr:tRNA glutamyl-Q(34) synthetase GluQRS [Chromatiales bacterium]